MTQPVQLSAEQFAALLGQLSAGNTGGNNVDRSPKSVKPVLPSVDIETTEGEWAIFEDQWLRFKRMAKLTAINDVRDNLRQCCATQLNKRLFDVKGPATLNAATEEELLMWIKEIAVKGVHKEVHRTQFVHLKQKQGETINSYYSRLKSESSLCDLRVPAPSSCADTDCQCANHGLQVSYQDDMVATQLIAGLYNSEHQAKILSESAVLTSLDDKLKRLLVLEKSDTSLSSLGGGSDAFSNYTSGNDRRKGRNERRKADGPKGDGPKGDAGGRRNDPCPDCKKKHPQCKTCNGYHKCTTQCNLCKGMGHIRNCCPNLPTVIV